MLEQGGSIPRQDRLYGFSLVIAGTVVEWETGAGGRRRQRALNNGASAYEFSIDRGALRGAEPIARMGSEKPKMGFSRGEKRFPSLRKWISGRQSGSKMVKILTFSYKMPFWGHLSEIFPCPQSWKPEIGRHYARSHFYTSFPSFDFSKRLRSRNRMAGYA